MSRPMMFFIFVYISISMMPLSGCHLHMDHPCEELCDVYTEAEEEWAEETCGGFYESSASVERKCDDICEDEYRDLSLSDRDDADACIECMLDDLPSRPDWDDIEDGFEFCEDICFYNRDVEDFFEDFEDDWFDEIEYEDDRCLAEW